MSLLKKNKVKERKKELKKLKKLLKQIEEAEQNKILVCIVDYPERII